MKRVLLLFASTALTVLLLGSGMAIASPVAEVEPNNSIAQAQNIDGHFSRDFDPEIIVSQFDPHATVVGTGNGSVDYYSFTVPETDPKLVLLDIDGATVPPATRTYPAWVPRMTLFDASGIPLDDQQTYDWPDPGSVSTCDVWDCTETDHDFTFDPYMEQRTFRGGGTYYVAVHDRFDYRSWIPSGQKYRLHVSVRNHPVPDTTPPRLVLPAPITEEAAGPDGAQVSWPAPIATDQDPASPNVRCSKESGATFPMGTTTVTCSATDAAGNEATGSFDVTVRDTTGPAISGMPSGVTRRATDASGATVSYDAPQTATDKVDGVVPVDCAPASGSTFPIGTTTVSCSAEDSRGNRTTETFGVDVVYDFGGGTGGGFAEPVTDGQLNEVKAGAGVPVKFGLGGDFGLDVFASGYPLSRRTSCDTQAVIDPIEQTVAISTSGLKYDAASGQYVYGWKTERAWAGSCRQLVVALKDGTEHAVDFKFK